MSKIGTIPPVSKPFWNDLTSMTPRQKIDAWLEAGLICWEHTNIPEPVETGWTYEAMEKK